MTNDYLNSFKSIQQNHKVIGKPMTEEQLKVLLKLMAVYQYSRCLSGFISTHDASIIITETMNKIRKGEIQKREKPYLPSQMLQKYIDKYPDQYKQIIERDL